MSDEVYYQAHRGTVDEGPENTLAALRYGWRFPGAIPETDVRTTADGALICVHDATLARTTDAPEEIANRPVRELTLDEVRRWDAGVRYSEAFAGQRVPTLDEVLDELAQDAARRLYLEPKDADLGEIKARLDRHGVTQRVLFVSGSPDVLAAIQRVLPGTPSMTWIGGAPATIAARLRQVVEAGVLNISQLQVHLYPAEADQQGQFALDDDLLLWAMERLGRQNVMLQVRPMRLSSAGLAHLLKLGIRWFVADAPGLFDTYLREARTQQAADYQVTDYQAADHAPPSTIYHIVTATAWLAAQAAGVYRPVSLDQEGFIHCSSADQVLRVANTFYRNAPDLLLLAIRAADLGDRLVYEAPAAADDAFAAQQFPHVYGPRPVESVLFAVPLPLNAAGEFGWPDPMPRMS